MAGKTVQRMAGPAKKPGTARMGIHRDSYALFTPNAGRTPRRGKVTVTVDKAAVAAAFATKRDTNAARTATVVTVGQAHRPPAGYVDAQAYSPVILPQSHTITR